MQSGQFSTLFGFMLFLTVLTRLWLAARQRRHVAAHRTTVPAVFNEKIGLTAHQRAADYTVSKLRLGLIELLLSTLFLIALTFTGGLALIHQGLLSLLPDTTSHAAFFRQILILVAVMVLSSAIDLPIAIYRQFWLEERFGFNRMTPRLFVIDLVKASALAAALGLPLVAVMLWLMQAAGTNWWLWAWLFWIAFNLAVLVLYPTVIAPLFNKFVPLEAGAVRERIELLLRRCGFESNGLFVMDGSKRSAHGNAYFTGMGRSKRIVFFDTLLAKLLPAEIEAVLAHELGHFKHKHIVKRIAMSFVSSLLGLALLGYLARQDWFFNAFGISAQSSDWPALVLVLFFLVLPVFTFPLQPLFSRMSRRHEFQADTFAATQTNAEDMIKALVKLYEDNASTLTPDPLHSAFYDSHPPAAQRIEHLLTLSRHDPLALGKPA
jgi:STE24 endopeptidase